MKKATQFLALACLFSATAAVAGPALKALPALNNEMTAQDQPKMGLILDDDYKEEAPNHKPLGLGISHSGDPYDIPDFSQEEIAGVIKSYGGSYYRPHVPLNEAMPEITQETFSRLQLAVNDPQELEALTDELAQHGKWERIDALVNAYTSAGVKLILVTGCGYRKEAPVLVKEDGKREVVSPSKIGRDVYITMTKWLVGAAVRRYAAKVQVWQVENEINTAVTHMLGKWRTKDSAWTDRKYGMSLLQHLTEVVHREGARQGFDLKTTQNYSTSLPGWRKYIKQSAQYVDIVGIDMYANYVAGWPPADKRMADYVLDAKAASGGKPVWVLEAGFADAPRIKGFTPRAQAAYFKRLIDRCFRNGAEVVLVFGWFWNPAGWYTDSGKPAHWYSPMAAEAHWSPIQKDPKTGKITFGPAWDEFKNAAEKWFK